MSALDYGISASNRDAIDFPFPSVAGGTVHAVPGLPAMIPSDQLYYWSVRWQADIHRSRDELAAGEYVEFDNGIDAARWFLSEE